MNAERRKTIVELGVRLAAIYFELEELEAEEEQARENMPEGLQQGEAYEKSEAASETLQEAISSLDDAIQGLAQIGA
jgi:thymidine phosphorylase